MYMMGKYALSFALQKAVALLVVSFFVLMAREKVVSDKLKKFGMVLAVLLWLGALVVLSRGLYMATCSRYPMMEMMKARYGCWGGNREQAPNMPMRPGMQAPEDKR